MSQGVRELQPLSQPKQFWGQLLNFSGNSQQQKKERMDIRYFSVFIENGIQPSWRIKCPKSDF